MSMEYFSGLSFRQHLEWPDCRAWCRKRFDYYVLNYAHTGRVAYSVDGSRQRLLQAPVAWWTWPGPLFSFGALRAERWRHHFVSFEGPRAAQMQELGLLPMGKEAWAHPRRPQEFRTRFLELFSALETPQPQIQLGVHLLEGLLLELKSTGSYGRDQTELALEQLTAAMRRQPWRSLSFAEWADKAGLSLAHFRRRFREQYSLPPGKYLQGIRLEAAADIIRSSSRPIKEVAAAVGIDDVLYLSRIFKRRFGYPPAAYRRAHHDAFQ
jgi:AraC-like DNA-binding protein